MRFYLSIFLIFATMSPLIFSQALYENVDSRAGTFLLRQNLKGNIEFDSEVRPYTRINIAQKLAELKLAQFDLNPTEIDEFNFLLQEYFVELSRINPDIIQDQTRRYHLYSYSDSLFDFTFSPIVGYGITSRGGSSGYERWGGAGVTFQYANWFNGEISIRDKGEFGDKIDREKSLTEKRGAWYKGAPDGIEYSDVIGSIGVSWSWGSLSLRKDYLRWGNGEFGQVILSDKAPSYPHLYLQLKPASWLRFSYIHGWLNSLVPDSSQFYFTYPGKISQSLSTAYRRKYIAANYLTFTPYDRLDISLGNAAVYSGDIRPEFLIPFMFFKLLDHNSGRGDVQDANGAMFFDVSFKYPNNFQFYSSLFIDVTEIRNILKDDFRNTWTAYTLGVRGVDVITPNLDFVLEYSRINPWVYEHRDQVTTYKHIHYPLGHWLGQNGDHLKLRFSYPILFNLKTEVFAERLRKGGIDEIYYAYNYQNYSDDKFSFLYGSIRKSTKIGCSITYEYIHDLNLQLNYSYSSGSDDDKIRSVLLPVGQIHDFSLTLFYGL